MFDVTAPRVRLGTRRLVLRPPVRSDAARMAELANDFEVAKMTGAMPFPYALADAEAFIERARRFDLACDVAFTLELPAEGLIGGLGFHARGGHGPEVGYWLGRPYWGRGLASEALTAAMAWARDEWEQRCVVAHYFVDNPASGAVLVKAGFLHTGEIAPRPCRARGEDTPSRGMIWLA